MIMARNRHKSLLICSSKQFQISDNSEISKMVKRVISKEAKIKRVDTNLELKKVPTKLELELKVKELKQTI